MIDRILEYLRLARFQTAGTTSILLVIGFLTVLGSSGMADVSPFDILILLIIGIMMHIFGFVLNEYCDIEVDRHAKLLLDKPLVSGRISPKKALTFVGIAFAVAYLLTILFFFSAYTILVLFLSTIFVIIYDVLGKKVPGLDISLAAGTGIFLILGGYAFLSNKPDAALPPLIYVFSFLVFLQILFNNAVEGGLKDVKSDASAGVRTLAMVLGVKPPLKINKGFKIFAYGIKIIHLLIVWLVLINLQDFVASTINAPYLFGTYIFAALFSLAILYTTWNFLENEIGDREKLKRIFSIHEISTAYLVIIVLLPIIGIGLTLFLLVLPLFWYIGFNALLYGNPMCPNV